MKNRIRLLHHGDYRLNTSGRYKKTPQSLHNAISRANNTAEASDDENQSENGHPISPTVPSRTHNQPEVEHFGSEFQNDIVDQQNVTPRDNIYPSLVDREIQGQPTVRVGQNLVLLPETQRNSTSRDHKIDSQNNQRSRQQGRNQPRNRYQETPRRPTIYVRGIPRFHDRHSDRYATWESPMYHERELSPDELSDTSDEGE